MGGFLKHILGFSPNFNSIYFVSFIIFSKILSDFPFLASLTSLTRYKFNIYIKYSVFTILDFP